MRISCTCMLLMATSVNAFAPAFRAPVRQFAGRPVAAVTTVRPSLAPRASRTAGVHMALPNPFRGILNKFSKRQRQPPTDNSEGVALFRQLGVTEDASFEEIQQAVVRLKQKYASDKKQCIRLDRIKDDILDLRLKQRMSTTARSGDVVRAEQRELMRDARDKRKKAWKIPKWTKGWVSAPEKPLIKQSLWTHSFFSIAGVILPDIAAFLMVTSALFMAVRISSKDAPEVPKDEMGRMQEGLLAPTAGTVFGTGIVTVSSFLVGVFLGIGLCAVAGEKVVPKAAWTVVGTNISFYIAGLFFTTYRGKK